MRQACIIVEAGAICQPKVGAEVPFRGERLGVMMAGPTIITLGTGEQRLGSLSAAKVRP